MKTGRRASAPSDPERAERVRLPDLRELVIRPIHARDAGPIEASFQLLHEDEVRRRFLHVLKALSEAHLHQITHPAPDREFVVVAAEPLPPGKAIVSAVARLSRDGDQPARAEFGLLVSHFVTGLGLGRILLKRLIEWSGQHGIRELWGDVMDDNTPMLALTGKLGFSRETIRGSPGLIRISLRLPAGKLRG